MTTTSVLPATPARETVPAAVPPARRRRRRGETVAGYLFLSPWLIGFLAVTAVPTVYSLYLSFTDYDLLTAPRWVGLDNYVRMFTTDTQFQHAAVVTVTFAMVSVPLKLAASLGVALLLKRNRRGVGLLRALFYVPSLLGSSVALAVVWQAIFSADGSVNEFLGWFGIPGKAWVSEPSTALGTLILLAVWQFGAPMVIFLAGLQQVPKELYEAASLDGAGRWRQFWHVTVPMLSPIIFFNLVLEGIHAFQGFTSVFVISGGTGGPADSTLTYTLYLYLRGFGQFQMGYASALAWVFLVVIGLATALIFRTGRFWVHYSDGGDR